MPTRTEQAMGMPAWLVDYYSATRDGGHQIDWANVSEAQRTTPGQTVTTTATAAAAATSIAVSALTYAIPSGTVLNFTGAGEFAVLSAAAAAGATSLTVEALDAEIESGDTALVAGSGGKFLPSGTVCGTLLGDGKISPRVVTTNPATCILLTDAYEDSRVAARTGYGVIRGGVIYENLLPEATGTPKVLASAVKTELNANGTGFSFSQSADSSAA